MIVDGTIHSVADIEGPEAAGVAPGFQRKYVRLDVLGLIRGQGSIPPQVGYIVDVPMDSPRLKDMRVLAFARPVAGRPDQLQLVSRGGQIPWSPRLDSMARGIARDLVSGDAPPKITGIGNVFHVPGTLPGESETQIFLETDNGDPISLSILRRPHQTPRWAVALGDIVGEAAEPPRRETLLWYRLACGLPERLPDAALEGQGAANAAAARADYQFVRDSLGPCGRN
ncbi:hypothetical protein [Stakelama saccharophila]|uniref:Uncharacterized protein n=1 Tax=Stakelama saccharophila TaxID=3075605 RepID=A0ABZ0B7I6_9SPHN|nr:hypothetical protein [Stakelama sp. W311]WNO52960.1 hypothetical protein RPR59_10885 [Stakelama sp. W311]